MKKIIPTFVLCFILITITNAQLLSTTNRPSQISSGRGIAEGPSIYGVFAGRTPCKELMADLNTAVSADCIKRKLGLTLFQDPATRQPTTYEIRGMGKWNGKGKWRIVNGTSTDPAAIVFQLDLDANTPLFILKGDDNVLFILDRNKNFLPGNSQFSYTLNRARN